MNAGPNQLPPSVVAARNARRATRAPDGRPARAYSDVAAGDAADDHAVQLAATRALLSAASPQEVAAIVATLVYDLGGGLLPARLDSQGRALPLDVSLGLSEPTLAWAEPVSVAAMRLQAVLPGFVEDARLVLDRLRSEAAGSGDATA